VEGRSGILDVHDGMDLHHRRQVDSADDSVARHRSFSQTSIIVEETGGAPDAA
jgi:hypothetical protein